MLADWLPDIHLTAILDSTFFFLSFFSFSSLSGVKDCSGDGVLVDVPSQFGRGCVFCLQLGVIDGMMIYTAGIIVV